MLLDLQTPRKTGELVTLEASTCWSGYGCSQVVAHMDQQRQQQDTCRRYTGSRCHAQHQSSQPSDFGTKG